MLTAAIIGAFVLMLLAPCVVAFMGRKEAHAAAPAVLPNASPAPEPEIPAKVVAENRTEKGTETRAVPPAGNVEVRLGRDQMIPPIKLSSPPPRPSPAPVQPAAPEPVARQAGLEAEAAKARMLAAEAGAALLAAEARVAQVRAEIAAERAAAAGKAAQQAIAAAGAARQIFGAVQDQTPNGDPAHTERTPDASTAQDSPAGQDGEGHKLKVVGGRAA